MAWQNPCKRRCCIQVCAGTAEPRSTLCAYCSLDHTSSNAGRIRLCREKLHRLRQWLYALPQAQRINIVERQEFLTQQVERLRAKLLVSAQEEQLRHLPALQADPQRFMVYTVFPDDCFIWGLSTGYWPADNNPSDRTRHLKHSSPWLADDGSRCWQWTSSVTGEVLNHVPEAQECHELRTIAPNVQLRPTSPPEADDKAHAVCHQVGWLEINCDLVLPPGVYTVLAWFTNPDFLNWDDAILESRAGAPLPYRDYRNAGAAVAKITDPYVKRQSRSPEVHLETFCDVLQGVEVVENGYIRVVLFQRGTRMALRFTGLHFIREHD